MSLFFFLGQTAAFASVDWTEFLPVRERLDPSEWEDMEYELHVRGFTSNASFPLYARLYNVTDGQEVSGSAFLATVATANAQARSAAFDLPAGVKDYAVQYGGEVGATFTLHHAVIKVVPV